MARKIKEGLRTGISPTQTGAMVGRFMGGLKKSIASGETPQSVLDKKRAQAQRIQRKVAARQADWKKDRVDPAAEYSSSMDRFGKYYRRGQGHQDPAKRAPEIERTPHDAPMPTHIQRAAKGLKPYRASTELVRGSRLALAEAVLDEYLSPKGYASKLGGSMKKFVRAGKPIEKAIHRKFPKTDADYYEGRGGGVGMTGTEDSRKEDYKDANKLVQRRANRVARVEKGRVGRFGQLGKPTKLSKRGFDDQDMPNSPAQKPKASFDYGSRNVGSRGRRKGRTTIQGIKDLFSGRKDPNYDGGY